MITGMLFSGTFMQARAPCHANSASDTGSPSPLSVEQELLVPFTANQ